MITSSVKYINIIKKQVRRERKFALTADFCRFEQGERKAERQAKTLRFSNSQNSDIY